MAKALKSIVRPPIQDPIILHFKDHNKRKLDTPFTAILEGKVDSPKNIKYITQSLTVSQTASFLKLLDILKTKKAKFLDERRVPTFNQGDKYATFLTGLSHVVKWELFWIRNPEEWEPRTHNAHRQFESLITHLFCKYKVPPFMYYVWTNHHDTYQEWLINLSQGENLRKQKRLPIPVTKMIAHHFNEAPEFCTVDQALQWGQLMSLNINKNAADKILKSPLGTQFNNNEFWLTVIKFLTENPFIPFSYYSQIYDYINHIKFTPRGRHINENGIAVLLGPLQPNFCMKGRTPESLLKAVDEWHKQGQKTKGRVNLTWTTCGVKPFTLKRKNCIYEIVELLSSAALKKEAEAMSHCVWSYDHECQNKKSAIFSMRKSENESSTTCELKLTIQLNLSSLTVVQARKRFNGNMTPEEASVLSEWARQNKLKLSTYL